ncbi:hypothetical protein [Arthrobacter sp. NicSoilB8]|uniref:hypothetical protein n=1 Tax=Arthrobacter sp. NicSoilB8 TaxID=2830998 RepID=UPI001CC36192|nr:hypothetical protein [Arthrobacter sp. NicSoilB8]BCW71405.1 hypothetical protein NicSoilB8_24490 [Arthrobacter sp. NicSoilB8]
MARHGAGKARADTARADVALPDVSGTGAPVAASRRRSRWQRYVDAAVLARGPGEYGGPEAGGRDRVAGKALAEVRSQQLGGSTLPGSEAHRPAGSAAPRDEPLTGHLAGRLIGQPPDRLAGHPAERLIGHLGRTLRPGPPRVGALRRDPTDRKRRTDLRLVPPALLVWGSAVAGNWWSPVELAVLCAGMAAAAGVLLFLAGRAKAGPATAVRGRGRRDGTSRDSTGRESTARDSPGRRGARRDGASRDSTRRESTARDSPGRRGARRGPRLRLARRSFRATLAVALLLAVGAGAHAAVGAARRHDGAIAEAVAARAPLWSRNWRSPEPRGVSGLPEPAGWRTAGQSR